MSSEIKPITNEQFDALEAMSESWCNGEASIADLNAMKIDLCYPAIVRMGMAESQIVKLEKEIERLRIRLVRLTNDNIIIYTEEPNSFECPICGGPADNGHDRSCPPVPYVCIKCEKAKKESEPDGDGGS